MNSIILFLVMVCAGIVATWIFELILKTNKRLRERYYKHHAVFMGYHVHHSMYGIICFILSIIYFFYGQPTHSLSMLAFGIGIIIMHTISDRKFVFIEKQRDKL